MEEFFRAVQSACPRSVWSRGVELARADAVTSESETSDEHVLRVTVPGNLMARIVTLYLEDEDWECSCSAQEDLCAHIAAATISLRRARKSGKTLSETKSKIGHIRYHFECKGENKSLHLERQIALGDHVEKLTHSLTAIAAGRIKTAPFHSVAHDLKVERILSSHSGEI